MERRLGEIYQTNPYLDETYKSIGFSVLLAPELVTPQLPIEIVRKSKAYLNDPHSTITLDLGIRDFYPINVEIHDSSQTQNGTEDILNQLPWLSLSVDSNPNAVRDTGVWYGPASLNRQQEFGEGVREIQVSRDDTSAEKAMTLLRQLFDAAVHLSTIKV